jgi:hypothetical protein
MKKTAAPTRGHRRTVVLVLAIAALAAFFFLAPIIPVNSASISCPETQSLGYYFFKIGILYILACA